MKVSILITVPMDKLNELVKDFEYYNGRILSVQEAKEIYLERFMADRADYIDTDNIKILFE